MDDNENSNDTWPMMILIIIIPLFLLAAAVLCLFRQRFVEAGIFAGLLVLYWMVPSILASASGVEPFAFKRAMAGEKKDDRGVRIQEGREYVRLTAFGIIEVVNVPANFAWVVRNAFTSDPKKLNSEDGAKSGYRDLREGWRYILFPGFLWQTVSVVDMREYNHDYPAMDVNTRGTPIKMDCQASWYVKDPIRFAVMTGQDPKMIVGQLLSYALNLVSSSPWKFASTDKFKDGENKKTEFESDFAEILNRTPEVLLLMLNDDELRDLAIQITNNINFEEEKKKTEAKADEGGTEKTGEKDEDDKKKRLRIDASITRTLNVYGIEAKVRIQNIYPIGEILDALVAITSTKLDLQSAKHRGDFVNRLAKAARHDSGVSDGTFSHAVWPVVAMFMQMIGRKGVSFFSDNQMPERKTQAQKGDE